MQLDPREDDLSEISMQARRNLAKAARRTAARRAKSRKRSARKVKTKEDLMKKARRMAIKIIRQRILKDKRYDDLPFAQREIVDKRVKKVPSVKLDTMARKLLPVAKAADMERVQRARAN